MDDGETHDLRGTVMALDRSIGFNVSCAESDWVALQPAFLRVWSELKAAPQ